MSERDDEMWARGHRAATVSRLQECLSSLYGDPVSPHNLDMANTDNARLILEREQVIALLRSLCDDYGDNDWPNNLHLTDVIEKHLMRHVRELLDEEGDCPTGGGCLTSDLEGNVV